MLSYIKLLHLMWNYFKCRYWYL